jgi:hypothetical protein
MAANKIEKPRFAPQEAEKDGVLWTLDFDEGSQRYDLKTSIASGANENFPPPPPRSPRCPRC